MGVGLIAVSVDGMVGFSPHDEGGLTTRGGGGGEGTGVFEVGVG